MNKTQLHKNLGKHLKDQRQDIGLTQAEVADRLGLTSPQFVSNFERGLCSPPLKDLKLLIKIYKMDANSVIKLILDQEEKRLRKALSAKSRRDH